MTTVEGLLTTAPAVVLHTRPVDVDPTVIGQLATSAATTGVVVAVPFVHRYYPMVRLARRRVRSGMPGPLHLLHGWSAPRRRGGLVRPGRVRQPAPHQRLVLDVCGPRRGGPGRRAPGPRGRWHCSSRPTAAPWARSRSATPGPSRAAPCSWRFRRRRGVRSSSTKDAPRCSTSSGRRRASGSSAASVPMCRATPPSPRDTPRAPRLLGVVHRRRPQRRQGARSRRPAHAGRPGPQRQHRGRRPRVTVNLGLGPRRARSSISNC